MEIRNFDKNIHYEMINHWLGARDMNPWGVQFFPKTGFVIYSEENPIAAGFIRICEGNLGTIESFVTDPSFDSELRNYALEILVNHIIQTAKELGITSLLAHTVDSSIVRRAVKNKFTVRPEVALVLNLMEGD